MGLAACFFWSGLQSTLRVSIKMEQMLPEENQSVEEKYECTHSPRCPKLSLNVFNLPAGGHFSGRAAGPSLSLGVCLRDANRGQAAKVQAVNETLSFCWYFLLLCLLNYALCFNSVLPYTIFQGQRNAFNLLHFLLALTLSLLFYCLIFQLHTTFYVFFSTNNPLYIYLSLLHSFFSLFFFFLWALFQAL